MRWLFSSDDREGNLVSLQESADALSDPRCYVLVGTVEGAHIGLLTAYKFPDLEAGGQLVYLYDIEVLASHRRNGLGALLLTALVVLCEAEGVKLIWAGTEATNTPARLAFEATEAELEGESYVEYEWDLEE